MKLGSINPYYLVEKTAEERPSLQKVRSYYSWNAEGETLQLLHKEDKSYFKYGTIISVSPSRRYCLLLGVDGVSKKKQLTIWDIDMDKLVSNCYIDACNVNNPFAGFSWDEENNRILYSSCFGSSTAYGCETAWFTDTDCYHSQLYCYDYNSHSCSACLYSPDFAYGQPTWVDATTYYSLGWNETPNHECMDAFNTLPSVLLHANLTEGTEEVISLPINPQWMRYSPIHNALILAGPGKDVLTHRSSMQLLLYSLHTHTFTCIHSSLFIASFPQNPLREHDSQLILNCHMNSNIVPFIVDLVTCQVSPLLEPNETPCIEYMCDYSNHLIVRMQSPSSPPSLYLYSLTTHQTTPLERTPSFSHMIQWSTFMTSDVDGCECILYQPITSEPTPLIVQLHGGPHNIFNIIFNTDILFYCSKGYSVLVPNYHGSFGFTDEYLHSLCGRIGEIEINDVLNAVDIVLSRQIVKRDEVYVMGSSFGGFMSMHLIEQRPSLFKKAIIRNPVLNTISMITSSDMFYWMYVLTKLIPSRGPWDEKTRKIVRGDYLYTAEDLNHVLPFSPLRHMDKIQAEICFILGKKDCKVINQQTLEAIRYLKAVNKKVELLVNPNDNHVLRTPLSRIITCEKVCDFFQ